MRITNSMLQQSVVAAVQANLQRIATAQAQVSSGLRITRASDDPVAAAQIMRTSQDLDALAQVQRNVTSAQTRVSAEDSVLTQITNLVTRAQELAVEESSSTATAATRASSKAEVDGLISQAVALGNTRVGDEYIFGGAQTTVPPFQANGAYVGDDTERTAEIGQGIYAATNHTGRDLLVSSGLLPSLQALSTALASGDGSAVGATAASLGTANAQIQSLVADTGARANQLDTAAQSASALTASLTARQSSLQDADVATTSTELLAAQTSLQAALLAASRVLPTSLANYLSGM
ncbi:MAG TPA: flagellar hook-associated protein FlgL [Candidatus Nitrosotalea sp.]|nr:flagellar hook-associated protein FlgL [Candidatus Nitrosotalea sp.]